MPLINCEINYKLKWCGKCFLVSFTGANQVPAVRITDTKFINSR